MFVLHEIFHCLSRARLRLILDCDWAPKFLWRLVYILICFCFGYFGKLTLNCIDQWKLVEQRKNIVRLKCFFDPSSSIPWPLFQFSFFFAVAHKYPELVYHNYVETKLQSEALFLFWMCLQLQCGSLFLYMMLILIRVQ